jgi:hypothetical protein
MSRQILTTQIALPIAPQMPEEAVRKLDLESAVETILPVTYDLTSQLDGMKTVFTIDESIDSTDYIAVYYGGLRLTLGVNYTVDTSAHTLTYLGTPPDTLENRHLILIVNGVEGEETSLPDLSDYYTKQETDLLVEAKAEEAIADALDKTEEGAIADAIDEAVQSALGDLTISGSNRGSVYHVDEVENKYRISGIPTIMNGGTGYLIGDSVQYYSTAGDLNELDALFVVTSVDDIGTIFSLTVSDKGVFNTDQTGVKTLVGGHGMGLQLNITTTSQPASTLAEVLNPSPNDFVTVIHDEYRNDVSYRWVYADRNGDGVFNWIRDAASSPTPPTSIVLDNEQFTITSGVYSLTGALSVPILFAASETAAQSASLSNPDALVFYPED